MPFFKLKKNITNLLKSHCYSPSGNEIITKLWKTHYVQHATLGQLENIVCLQTALKFPNKIE